MKKTFVGLIRDHSGSMASLALQAANDYNLTLNGIKQSVLDQGQAAYLTVVECGYGHTGKVRVVQDLKAVELTQQVTSYTTTGRGTPLWDSVGEAIQSLESMTREPDAAFLVMAITDGHENNSWTWTARTIGMKIASLQATDKWTFVFRVPKGYKAELQRAGIPAGNIMEWEQTEKALVAATTVTVNAVQEYFMARSAGETKTTKFFANLEDIPPEVIKASLIDVSSTVKVQWVSSKDDGMQIRDFCNKYFGKFETGHALYQLTKKEDVVQDYKRLCIRDKTNGKIFSGSAARQLLNLPTSGNIQLSPGAHGQYDLFIQSNSVNRKVQKDTSVLYM